MVVGFGVAPLHARHGVLRKLRLDAHHGARLCVGAVGVVAEELERARDVLLVFVARLLRLVVGVEIVVAVWKAEAALRDLRDDGGRVLEVLRRAEAEDGGDAVRVEDGDLVFESAEVFDGGDAIKLRLERRVSGLLD